MYAAKLSEDSKRLLIALLFALIVFFVIVGCIGLIVKKIMKKQAEGADNMLYDVIRAGIFNRKNDLIKFGIKKNHLVFFRQAWKPFMVMVIASVILILYCLIMNNWDVDIFDYKTEGIGTLFHVFDWANVPKTKIFGITLISDWPPLLSTPHWSWDAWGAYIFIPSILVGLIWFMFCVQAYIARTFRIFKVAKKVFDRTIDDLPPQEKPIEPIK